MKLVRSRKKPNGRIAPGKKQEKETFHTSVTVSSAGEIPASTRDIAEDQGREMTAPLGSFSGSSW